MKKPKMKKIFPLLSLLCITAFAFGQKTINDPNAEVRKVSSFTGVSVSGGIDLYLSQGDEAVVVSAAKSEWRDKIKTEVVDGILKIGYDSKLGISINITSDRKLRAY